MLNSLNIEMCNEIKHLFSSWSSDSSVAAILMRGEGEKAFCAGGDVKSMYHAIKEKGPTIGNGSRGEPSADFFRDEYEMNYLLAHSPIPQVLSSLPTPSSPSADLLLGWNRNGWWRGCLNLWEIPHCH
jgi:enoyl-CoA hydratase